MDFLVGLSIILLGAFAGLLIGAVGIGGVVVVPAMTFLFGIPVNSALAATMLAFLVSGIVGTTAYSASRALSWRAAGWLWAGAAPAALAAGLMTHRVAAWMIEAVIGLLALGSGVYSVRGTRRVATGPATPIVRGSVLIGSGAVTGILSALTGTSGPLVLIPILLRLEIPVLTALGLAQAIQLPIALSATAGHWLAGTAEPTLGIALGIGLGVGTWGGSHLAHRTAQRSLRLIVSALLVMIGLAMLLKLALLGPSP